MTDVRDQLRGIRTFPSLVRFLRDELDWPIDSTADFETLTFEYTPDELGIDPKSAAKIESIQRLRPLSTKQPWGIFFVKFEPKKLPIVALRRLLSQVALKKRASANSAERAVWAADDLLFISNYGDGDQRQITFAHFSQDEARRDLPTLKVLGWNNLDTALHLDDAADTLRERLAWPSDDADVNRWRETWRSAFTLQHREVIATSRELSIRLAELARAIRDRIRMALAIETAAGPLTKLMKAFQEALVHDLDTDTFSDMYAQTIAYGLLSARLASPGGGSADDLASQMPVTNPFLKELMETFLHVGGRRGKAGGPGIDFDELGVSDVVEMLDHANMRAVLVDFGDRNPQEDPVIHFYEHFLAAYDRTEKVRRGVFYTPRPVVSFIVRSVDERLETAFGLVDGLADITTWGEMADRHRDLQIPPGVGRGDAFVQILDPATGTGTFLVEVIDVIYRRLSSRWASEGHGDAKINTMWNAYVPRHLLPRLHGYELLMAPYAIAHLKLGLKLHETGYEFGSDERARVYLTNSLEPPHDFSGQFDFAIPALAHEAEAVNAVKRDARFTVMIGNPPYSILSANLSPAQRATVARYREVDGERIRERGALQFEKNIQDDYVKFFALAEDVLLRSPWAVLCYISNGNYLDADTLRGLRASLCSSFQERLLLDLHGDGSGSQLPDASGKDENVFEILQGVAIGLFARGPTLPDLTIRGDRGGSRAEKFAVLARSTFNSVDCRAIGSPKPPQYEFAQRDDAVEALWRSWTGIAEIFGQYSAGIITARDHFVIDVDRAALIRRVTDFRDSPLSDTRLLEEFDVPDKRGWDVRKARLQLSSVRSVRERTLGLSYRPFDQRWIFYEACLVWGRAFPTMRHLLGGHTVALAVCKQLNKPIDPWAHAFVTRSPAESSLVSNKSKEITTFFPVWLAADENSLLTQASPNIDHEWLDTLGGLVATTHTTSEQNANNVAAYVYAILHSPIYRARFREQLARGFPRIPIAESATLAHGLVKCGLRLIALHLMESPVLDKAITTYVGPPRPSVARVGWSEDTVWLDSPAGKAGTDAPGTIGFRGVHDAVWQFRIGAYQVCHKWLKDRKGTVLSGDDLRHYGRIVVALSETITQMDEIDRLVVRHGGWPDAFLSPV
jgi:predicted helicase